MPRVRTAALLLCALVSAGVWVAGCAASPPPPQTKCPHLGVRNLDADDPGCVTLDGEQPPLRVSHTDVMHVIDLRHNAAKAAQDMEGYVGEIRPYPKVTVMLIEYPDGAIVWLRATPARCASASCVLQPADTRITEASAQKALANVDDDLINALKMHAAEQGSAIRAYGLQVEG